MYTIYLILSPFTTEKLSSINITHEHTQTAEDPLLENIHATKLIHKSYHRFQITNHEFAIAPEEIMIIKALELFGPLQRTKKIVSLLAKLPMHSATINASFPMYFCSNERFAFVIY